MSRRPDWNLFSGEQHRPARIGVLRAMHDAANVDEAQRILADAERTGETGLLENWARDVIERNGVATEGRAGQISEDRSRQTVVFTNTKIRKMNDSRCK